MCSSAKVQRGAKLLTVVKTFENSLKFQNLSKTRWIYCCSESIDAVWRSYELIPDAIDIITAENVKAKGNGLKKKLATFDFLFALMFMQIMMKTKTLTKQLQEEELNIVNALTIIDATMENLKFITNYGKGLNAEIESMLAFGSKVEVDALAEYTHYRTRRLPTRIDDNSDQMAEISFQEFYRKKMFGAADNVKVFIDQIQPLGESLQLPLTKPKPIITN